MRDGRLWQETGCADVLRHLLGERQFGFDVERAIYLTVLHRLMVSGSDRHAHDWHQRLRIPGAEALTLRQAYKAMAWLGETTDDDRPITELIEEAVYRHRQPLFGELSVAFFDTTSLYFEGRGGATLGQRGFSKDFRPQLLLGIVLDGHDRPIASFLWPGNTADVTTLLPVVERLRTRFAISRACVVADRGMISAATIAGLEAQGIDYILGVRERSTAEVRTTVIDDDGVAVPGPLSPCSTTIFSILVGKLGESSRSALDILHQLRRPEQRSDCGETLAAPNGASWSREERRVACQWLAPGAKRPSRGEAWPRRRTTDSPNFSAPMPNCGESAMRRLPSTTANTASGLNSRRRPSMS